MKKIINLFIVFLLGICTCLAGCSSSSASSRIELQEGVSFELMDVLKIINPSTNAVYYYFLAGVTNTSDAEYHMSNMSYYVSDSSGKDTTMINPIDKFQSTITNNLRKDQSTSVYGYIGFPNSNEKNPGLYFPVQEAFIPFSSVKIREINDEEVVNSLESKFVIYEDDYFSFDVDASKLKYSWNDGQSLVDGLVITYTNKTDSMLVVPYLTPICTIDGLDINDLSNTAKLKKMSLQELKKQDFSKNGLAPKTTSYTGDALGYQLYYLTALQSVSCQISFTFEDIIPDFSTAGGAGGIRININSPALGYSQILRVNP